MATRDTLTTVADGDQLNDGYFNGMLAATNRLVASDTSVASITSSSFTNIASASVAAGAITDHVIVAWDYYTKPNNNGETQFQIKIDTTIQEGPRKLHEVGTNNASGHQGTVFWYYTPSAGEKSAGFTVNVEAKANDTIANSVTSENLYVFGA